MADDASETWAGGIKNYLGTLGFILPLLGGEELVRWYVGGITLPPYASSALVAAGLPAYLSPAAWKTLRRVLTGKSHAASKPAPLGYLHGEDSDLGDAIRSMGWASAWAKWYASQFLAKDDHKSTSECHLMNTAAHVVFDALMDGRLEAKGRRPGQLDYDPIPRTHWRVVALSMVKDDAALWKMAIVPRGISEITPEGEVIGRDKKAMELRNQLAAYDSFIVSSRQFESLWPRKDRGTDRARKKLLKAAKKAGADSGEIKKLSRS